MNRVLSFVCAAALVALTACEDVPAPYEINSNGGNTNTTTLLSETFSSSLGKFTNITTEGSVAWANSYSCATATGYDSSTKKTTDGVAYLVSPSIDLTEVDTANVTYDYILRYVRKQDYQKLMIAEDFTPSSANTAEQAWEDLITTHTEGSDYTTFSSAAVNIPAKYMGKKIRLALYFKCETNSSTWEVKNFKVSKGLAEENTTPDEPSGEDKLPYSSTSLSEFTAVTVKGTAWSAGSKYAKATGYDSNTKATTETEAWYVSPAINTTASSDEKAYLDFDYVIRYLKSGNINDLHKVLISTDYDGDVAKATWTNLNFNAKESETQDWTFYAAESMEIPTEFMNQEKVYIAFRFECSSSNSTTWELQNLSIHQGKKESGDSGDSGDVQPQGDNLLGNGDFETWNGSTPANWKSTTSASSATISQSNDAHGGNYAALVTGSSSANKRLAYKEITLKAGTYTFKFYTKAATADGGSVRPGYATVTDGKISSTGYTYGDYTNDLNSSTWTEVSYEFTLASQTTLNLVIMNPKKPGANIFVDDAQLTTADGGLVDGGDSDDSGDKGDASETETGKYSIDFTKSTTGWTINDIDLGSLSYVWKQNTTYGMKASAFANNTNNAAEATFVSPKIVLPVRAQLTINHALNFLSGNNRADYVTVKLLFESGKTETLELSQWPAGTDYTYIDSQVSLADHAGETVQIVFHYKSTTSCAPTWEIKTLTIN